MPSNWSMGPPTRLKSFPVFAPVIALFFVGAIVAPGLYSSGLRAQGANDSPPPLLSLPLDCQGNDFCVVQNYVDTDPGPGVRDHACGSLSYDGHKGTDLRLRDLAEMRAGVAVLAAADGVVLGQRDGMADVNARTIDRSTIKDRECGNGVVLGHPGGWTTQYCHMRRGSIATRKGQQVSRGQKLGLIGLSGLTEFPHIHIGLRRGKEIIDPFTGRSASAGGQCGEPGVALWRESALALLKYRSSGLIRAGFSVRAPTMAALENGDHGAADLPSQADKFFFWSLIFGLQKNDVEEFVVRRPDGEAMIHHRSKPAVQAKAQWFTYVGRSAKGKPWPTGRYQAAYRLLRRNKVSKKWETVISARRAVTLR